MEEEEEVLNGFSVDLNPRDGILKGASENFGVILGQGSPEGRSIFEYLVPEDGERLSFDLRKRDFSGKGRYRFRRKRKGTEVLEMRRRVSLEKRGVWRLVFVRPSTPSSPQKEWAFSTRFLQGFKVAQVFSENLSRIPLLVNENFLDRVQSPEDGEYLRARLKGRNSGLSRSYILKAGPSSFLALQTKFYFVEPNEVIARHFVIKEYPEPSSQTINERKRSLEEDNGATQKNKLLKELLKVNYNTSSSNDTNPTCSSNSRILQLLNSKSADPHSRKRSSPLSYKSPMCSQNPALADLLARPPYHASVTIPPPVPMKWHQEPCEKLPRDIMRKYLPSNRSNSSKPASDPQLTGTGEGDTHSSGRESDYDPMLSEILDGVIDIQEKSSCVSKDVGKQINLSDIEKFLSSSDAQQPVPPSSFQSTNPSRFSAPNNTVSLIPRMNELFGVVPPNVSIPSNSEMDPSVRDLISEDSYSKPSGFSNVSMGEQIPSLTDRPNFTSQRQHLIRRTNYPRENQNEDSQIPKRGGSLLLQLLSE